MSHQNLLNYGFSPPLNCSSIPCTSAHDWQWSANNDLSWSTLIFFGFPAYNVTQHVNKWSHQLPEVVSCTNTSFGWPVCVSTILSTGFLSNHIRSIYSSWLNTRFPKSKWRGTKFTAQITRFRNLGLHFLDGQWDGFIVAPWCFEKALRCRVTKLSV